MEKFTNQNIEKPSTTHEHYKKQLFNRPMQNKEISRFKTNIQTRLFYTTLLKIKTQINSESLFNSKKKP